MKNKILQLIASSKNSYELADRICELWEEREKEIEDNLKRILRDKYIVRYPEDIKEGKIWKWRDVIKRLHPSPEEQYPCADCGTLRTKAVGGTTFTVCDECWDKRHPTPTSPKDSQRDGGKGKKKGGAKHG